jgi:hypothetical protein
MITKVYDINLSAAKVQHFFDSTKYIDYFAKKNNGRGFPLPLFSCWS